MKNKKEDKTIWEILGYIEKTRQEAQNQLENEENEKQDKNPGKNPTQENVESTSYLTLNTDQKNDVFDTPLISELN